MDAIEKNISEDIDLEDTDDLSRSAVKFLSDGIKLEIAQ